MAIDYLVVSTSILVTLICVVICARIAVEFIAGGSDKR